MCAEAVGHFRCVCPANYRIDEDTYASCKGIVLIGASVSEPHTSEVNCQYYLAYIVPYILDTVI